MTVNLTTEAGTGDWAHWGVTGPTFDHKSAGGTQISNLSTLGNGVAVQNPNQPVVKTPEQLLQELQRQQQMVQQQQQQQQRSGQQQQQPQAVTPTPPPDSRPQPR